MPALVQAGIATARVRAHHVLLETVADIFGLPLEYHEHAEADVVGNDAPVLLQRRNHLDLAFLVQHAAFGDGPADEGNVVHRGGRIAQAVGGRGQDGGGG